MSYLQDVDHMVGQPEEAEGQHNGQDELLTANAAAEFSLSNPPQDTNVTDQDDPIRDQKSQHNLHHVLKNDLWRAEEMQTQRNKTSNLLMMFWFSSLFAYMVVFIVK